MEKKIGKVTHYFNKLGVAAVELDDDTIQKGDHIHIVGHTTDTELTVDSIELNHHPIEEGHKGENVGVYVGEHVRENDDVYKTYI